MLLTLKRQLEEEPSGPKALEVDAPCKERRPWEMEGTLHETPIVGVEGKDSNLLKTWNEIHFAAPKVSTSNF